MSVPFTELPVSTRRITVVVQTVDNKWDECEVCWDNDADGTCTVCSRRVCYSDAHCTFLKTRENATEHDVMSVLCVDCKTLPVTIREKITAFVKELNT